MLFEQRPYADGLASHYLLADLTTARVYPLPPPRPDATTPTLSADIVAWSIAPSSARTVRMVMVENLLTGARTTFSAASIENPRAIAGHVVAYTTGTQESGSVWLYDVRTRRRTLLAPPRTADGYTDGNLKVSGPHAISSMRGYPVSPSCLGPASMTEDSARAIVRNP